MGLVAGSGGGARPMAPSMVLTAGCCSPRARADAVARCGRRVWDATATGDERECSYGECARRAARPSDSAHEPGERLAAVESSGDGVPPIGAGGGVGRGRKADGAVDGADGRRRSRNSDLEGRLASPTERVRECMFAAEAELVGGVHD
jgi:hypothetical protein